MVSPRKELTGSLRSPFYSYSAALSIAAVALVCYSVLMRWPNNIPVSEPPRPFVRARAVEYGDVPLYAEAVGIVEPSNMVTIKTPVDGQIVMAYFEEGKAVRAGDALFEIDARQFRARLAKAEAILVRDQVLLANARADLDREVRLKEFASRQSVDTQRALVAQYEATVRADQAEIDLARLQVDDTIIRAPISGVAGKRIVDVGNFLLAADSRPLLQISQIEPISVKFGIPQRFLQQVRLEAAKGPPLLVEARSEEGGSVLAEGKLTVIGDAIDSATGTIPLKSLFDNCDHALWPGQFLHIRLVFETLRRTVVLPTEALQAGPDGPFVFVIGPDSRVTVRSVKIMTKADGLAAIAEGVEVGERVVVEGQMSIAEGTSVIAAD